MFVYQNLGVVENSEWKESSLFLALSNWLLSTDQKRQFVSRFVFEKRKNRHRSIDRWIDSPSQFLWCWIDSIFWDMPFHSKNRRREGNFNHAMYPSETKLPNLSMVGFAQMSGGTILDSTWNHFVSYGLFILYEFGKTTATCVGKKDPIVYRLRKQNRIPIDDCYLPTQHLKLSVCIT